jgi:hypothetical protein
MLRPNNGSVMGSCMEPRSGKINRQPYEHAGQSRNLSAE